MPSDESKRELTVLAKVSPNTQNSSLKLGANLQIARADLSSEVELVHCNCWRK